MRSGAVHEGAGAGERELPGRVLVGIGVVFSFADREPVVPDSMDAIETPEILGDGLSRTTCQLSCISNVSTAS